MDPLIAERLRKSDDNPHFDAEFSQKIGQTAREYIEAGLNALNYYIPDFDAATDLVEMHAPIEGGPEAFSKMDRNSALQFRHPLTFTEMVTLTSFVAQILFGGTQARSVEPQGPDDDNAAESVNALLAWNDGKIDIYLQGWMWCWAAIVYNRGVWYESAAQDVRIEKEIVEEDDITKEKEPVLNKDGTPRMRKGEPVMAYPKRHRLRNKRIYEGFYNRVDLVSPYDFICDPTLPLCRMNEMRFTGHRVMIPWHELKRRSELDPGDDNYVLPHVVAKIKNQRGQAINPIGTAQTQSSSRTFYERTARLAQTGGIGGGAGVQPGTDAVNKEDGGNVECWCLTIRAKPCTLKMYDDDAEPELITFLVTNLSDVLSVNVRSDTHDEFPYAVAEGMPNAHRQFSKSWALRIKNVQDRVDDLNTTHSSAQKRMGNILLIDAAKCDASNLLSPDKNGLLILRTNEGKGVPADEVVKQIPLTDTTARYPDEMAMWELTAEKTTGAHAQVQGQTTDPSQTATQFEGVQEMSTGRISSVARLLSQQAITKQTRRFYKNFAAYMPDEMIVKALGKGSNIDPDVPVEKYKTVKRQDIQGEFTVVPHDGAMPGAQSREVAAGTRALEASQNPALASAFDVTLPGALDPIKILRSILEKSGLNPQQFTVTREEAQRNALARQMATGGGVPPPQSGQPPAAPVPIDPATGMPSAAQLPPIPSAEPPPPAPTGVA